MIYKHLGKSKRYQICALIKVGHNQTEIAQTLVRYRSPISREISRNSALKAYQIKLM